MKIKRFDASLFFGIFSKNQLTYRYKCVIVYLQGQQVHYKHSQLEEEITMTNAMIVLLESVKLMEAGVIKGSGVKGLTPEGKEIELPEAIHTYQTWKQLGYQVKRGSKAVAQFPIWKHTSKQLDELDDNGEPKERTNMFMKNSSWFTREQVEEIKK